MKVGKTSFTLAALGASLLAAMPAQAHDGWGNRGYDNGYDRGGWNGDRYDYDRRGGGPAVDQCVRAARNEASRYGRVRVSEVNEVEEIRGGLEIRGRLVVERRGYGGYGRYGSYGGDDYDKGRFTCIARYGGIEQVRLRGLKGYY